MKNGFHIWPRIDATEVVKGMGTPEFGSGAGSGGRSGLVTTTSLNSCPVHDESMSTKRRGEQNYDQSLHRHGAALT